MEKNLTALPRELGKQIDYITIFFSKHLECTILVRFHTIGVDIYVSPKFSKSRTNRYQLSDVHINLINIKLFEDATKYEIS